MMVVLQAEGLEAPAVLPYALNDDNARRTKFGSNVVVKPIAKTVAKIAKSLGVSTEDSVK
ncbi:MAG: hypothetical protein L0287_29480 [Anaerolineae bacterium]|nr:hypothetical protein [Anaerolineae bacterium]